MSGRSVEVGTIRQHCKTLRMPTVASQCHKLAEQARRDKQSHVRYLDVLLSAEVEEREHRAVQRSSDAMPASSCCASTSLVTSRSPTSVPSCCSS